MTTALAVTVSTLLLGSVLTLFAGEINPVRLGSPRQRWASGEMLVQFTATHDPKLKGVTQGNDLEASRFPAALKSLHTTNKIVLAKALVPDEHRSGSKQAIYMFRFKDLNLDVQAACVALSQEEGIEFAEPNYFLYPTFVPDDPYFASSGSWGQLYDDQWGLKIPQFPAAWDLVSATNEVIVAVLDSGIDFTHPDLVGRISSNGWNYIAQNANPTDDSGHGTICSGIIAASLNNGVGIAGAAKYVKILPVKFLPESGPGTTADAVSGLHYAANHGARVINMSFGGETSASLEGAINGVSSLGVVLVGAAGNDYSIYLQNPASSRNVIAVGASTHADALADFSSYGPKVDIVAPGGDSGGSGVGDSILSLRAANTLLGHPVGNGYIRTRGTSFSSPFVCGVVALMLNQRPWLQNEEIRQILRMTADDVMAPGWDLQTSYGRVNAFRALQRNSAVVTLIDAPGNFAILGATLSIQGRSFGTAFDHFLVEYGPGQVPTNWTVIASNNVSVTNGQLAAWDTTLVPDGTYSVRVRSFDAASFESQDRIILTISNFDPPVHAGWPQAGFDANKGAPVAADLDGDGQKELLWGRRGSLDIRRNDGFTSFPGWPKPTADTGPAGPPSVADLDGNGSPEVGLIVNDYHNFMGQISIWHADGTTVAGWPKDFVSGNGDIPNQLSPVFADIDGDSSNEVIWCSSTATSGGTTVLHVDRPDGTAKGGWPVTLPFAAGPSFSSPAVGDIDGDGFLDIAVTTFNGQTYLFHHDGSPFPGWPVTLGSGGSIIGAVGFADMDHDGELEVITTSYDGAVGIFKSSGQSITGWPRLLGKFPRAPSFGDLDGDGRLEIAIGNQDGILYVFHDNGTSLSGWPKSFTSRIYSPSIADIDHDGRLDLISASGDGNIYAWNAQGDTLFALGFPIYATPAYSAPLVTDVNNDGRLEILALTTSVWIWDLASDINLDRMPYPELMGDPTHQSRFKTPVRLTSISPPHVVANQSSILTISGDFFLKGMRAFLGTNPLSIVSESVTSITVNLPNNLTPKWYDLILHNANSYRTTFSNTVDVISSVDGDDDGDTLPNAWEAAHGLDPHDNGVVNADNGPSGDPDRDGMQNRNEYLAGTDPKSSVSFLRLTSIQRPTPGQILFSWPSVSGKHYKILSSTSLMSGFEVITSGIPATPPTNSFTDSLAPGVGMRFYRIGVP